MRKPSDLEILFERLLEREKFPTPEKEYKFCEGRRWKFDFAYPDQKIAIECEGGIWTMGRHTRGKGFMNDCEKYNRAAIDGWKVLRYTTNTIEMSVNDLNYLFYKI